MIDKILRQEIYEQLLDTPRISFMPTLECIPFDILEDLLQDEGFHRDYAQRIHAEEKNASKSNDNHVYSVKLLMNNVYRSTREWTEKPDYCLRNRLSDEYEPRDYKALSLEYQSEEQLEALEIVELLEDFCGLPANLEGRINMSGNCIERDPQVDFPIFNRDGDLVAVNNTGVPFELLKMTAKYISQTGEFQEKVIDFGERERLRQEIKKGGTEERRKQRIRKSLIRKYKGLLSIREERDYIIYEFADTLVRWTRKLESRSSKS